MQALAKACLAATLAAISPGMISQIRRPTKQGLLLAMAQSSLSFFLFSYQARHGHTSTSVGMSDSFAK